jgi:hypothetical protein
MKSMIRLAFATLLFPLLLSLGCVSSYLQTIGGDTNQIFQRIYTTDWDSAWQATLEALKHTPLSVSNQESGFLQTKWIDNTAEKNFTDSFGEADNYLKAQYRFQVSLSKGYFNHKPTVKVSIQKEQMVQRDALEGWNPQETDSIDENTLLYRIGRLIYVRTRMTKIEEEKTKRELKDTKF